MALRRRWLLALGLGLLCATAAGVTAWYLKSQTYTVQTLLHVSASQPKIIFDTAEQRADFLNYQRAQVALIRTRFVLTRALRDPEVAQLPVLQKHPDPVAWLGGEIRADYSIAPEIFRIAMTGESAEELKKLVIAVREAYVKEIADKEHYSRFARLDQLKKLYDRYDTNLQERRKKLRQLAETLGSRDSQNLQLRQQFALSQLNSLQGELLDLRSQIRKAQLELADRRDKEKAALVAKISEATLEELISKDDVVQDYENRVLQLDQSLAQIRARTRKPETELAYKRTMTAMSVAKKTLADRRKELGPVLTVRWRERARLQFQADRAHYEEQLGRLKKLEALLSKEVGERDEELRSFKKQTVDVEWLNDEITQAKEMADAVGKQRQALEVEIDAPQRVRLLEDAIVTDSPSASKRMMGGALAGGAGFALALFGVSLFEFRRRRVSSADEVVQGLGIDLVGTLPLLPDGVRRRLGGPKTPRDRYWHNLFTESLNAVRTALVHRARREQLRVIMVTSALQGEGKSLVSCHLAASLARAGFKTLLVDADLRRPAVHQVFNLEATPGLSEVLSGAVGIDSAIRPGPVEQLGVLPAGQRDEQTIQALARGRAGAVWDQLRELYDFIVIDSPPVLPVADSLLIGQHTDGVVFSVLRDVSRLPSIYAAYERLTMLNIRILGAVVNGGESELYGSAYAYATLPGEHS
jgi:capsular exopolysaccharide synthesis family protein